MNLKLTFTIYGIYNILLGLAFVFTPSKVMSGAGITPTADIIATHQIFDEIHLLHDDRGPVLADDWITLDNAAPDPEPAIHPVTRISACSNQVFDSRASSGQRAKYRAVREVHLQDIGLVFTKNPLELQKATQRCRANK